MGNASVAEVVESLHVGPDLPSSGAAERFPYRSEAAIDTLRRASYS